MTVVAVMPVVVQVVTLGAAEQVHRCIVSMQAQQ
jgi:hypothetical protein